jgi:hypothetical protein
VAALTALTSLSLRGCSALSDAAPARLAPLAQLRHLALGGPAVSDAGLVHCIVLTGAPRADAPPAPPWSLGALHGLDVVGARADRNRKGLVDGESTQAVTVG